MAECKANLADEIKITPEMIDAARDVLEEYYIGDSIYIMDNECLTKIYVAMERHRFS